MKRFPLCIRVSYQGQMNADTVPNVAVNPTHPINCTASRHFRVSDDAVSGPVGLQVAKGLGLFPLGDGEGRVEVETLIYQVRAYSAVMQLLDARDTADRFNYGPVGPDALIGNVSAENCMVLCSLVYDVFGPAVGQQQADLLATNIGREPETIEIREQVDIMRPDIKAAGPICCEGGDKWRVVLREVKANEFVVHTQFFPKDGGRPYFDNGSYATNWLVAVEKFCERVKEKAMQQHAFDNGE